MLPVPSHAPLMSEYVTVHGLVVPGRGASSITVPVPHTMQLRSVALPPDVLSNTLVVVLSATVQFTMVMPELPRQSTVEVLFACWLPVIRHRANVAYGVRLAMAHPSVAEVLP
ncbi:MAG: hypothetical protein BWY06_02956 [Candidatus Latescibacteria bacterium ADurb.Bin168]|nr:MAG: hypothetical protein BWY06_02956 [Candidatus Latescibacteria bacterium ADurb.Bin168]